MQVYTPFRRFVDRRAARSVAVTSLAALAVLAATACANGVDPAETPDDPGVTSPVGDAGKTVDSGKKPGSDATTPEQGPPVTPPGDAVDAGADTAAKPPTVVDAGKDTGTTTPPVIDAAVDTGTTTQPPSGSACLLISEYVESSANKALEIWNCGSAPIALDAYVLCLESNTAATCTTHLPLTGTLAAGKTYVVCASTIGTACSTLSNVVNFNGNDRIALFRDTNANTTIERGTDVVVDSIGQLGAVPPAGVLPSNANPWQDTDLRRTTCTPFAGASAFTTASLYASNAVTSLTNLGVPPAISCP